MTTYQAGDLVLVAFPFASRVQVKQRPALIVLDTGDADIVAARIISQRHRTRFDVILADWREAGPLSPSVGRVHTLATLERALVRRQLGRLLADDHERVREVPR